MSDLKRELEDLDERINRLNAVAGWVALVTIIVGAIAFISVPFIVGYYFGPWPGAASIIVESALLHGVVFSAIRRLERKRMVIAAQIKLRKEAPAVTGAGASAAGTAMSPGAWPGANAAVGVANGAALANRKAAP